MTNSAVLKDIYSSVNISISGAYYVYAGGLVGYQDGGNIINSFSKGNVSATGATLFAYAGGIAGYGNSGSISGCYSAGNITANGSDLSYSRNGQIVGDKTQNIVISKCYKYNGAIVTRFGTAGNVYNDDGASDTNTACKNSLMSIWDLNRWNFENEWPKIISC